jgi:hypothetical protein
MSLKIKIVPCPDLESNHSFFGSDVSLSSESKLPLLWEQWSAESGVNQHVRMPRNEHDLRIRLFAEGDSRILTIVENRKFVRTSFPCVVEGVALWNRKMSCNREVSVERDMIFSVIKSEIMFIGVCYNSYTYKSVKM